MDLSWRETLKSYKLSEKTCPHSQSKFHLSLSQTFALTVLGLQFLLISSLQFTQFGILCSFLFYLAYGIG